MWNDDLPRWLRAAWWAYLVAGAFIIIALFIGGLYASGVFGA